MKRCSELFCCQELLGVALTLGVMNLAVDWGIFVYLLFLKITKKKKKKKKKNYEKSRHVKSWTVDPNSLHLCLYIYVF